MIKSFKDYIKDTDKPKPSMETQFGSHSVKPSMETQFGSHSKEKPQDPKPKPLDESKMDDHTKEEQDHIHNKVAPENKKLDVRDKQAISKYTAGSKALNDSLHKAHKKRPITHEEKEHADDLTNTLNKHKTTEDSAVYTGLKRSPVEHFHSPHEHAHVHLPAFTSTSTSKRSAHNFADDVEHKNDKHHGVEHGEFGAQHILKLHLPKGTSAMSVRKKSHFKDENEVLVNRGHDIKIHPKPTHLGNHVYQWDAHVVGHSPVRLKTEDDE